MCSVLKNAQYKLIKCCMQGCIYSAEYVDFVTPPVFVTYFGVFSYYFA
jgi:hypothetical protein